MLPKVAVFRYPVSPTTESAPPSRRRVMRDILLYGVCSGMRIAVLNPA